MMTRMPNTTEYTAELMNERMPNTTVICGTSKNFEETDTYLMLYAKTVTNSDDETEDRVYGSADGSLVVPYSVIKNAFLHKKVLIRFGIDDVDVDVCHMAIGIDGYSADDTNYLYFAANNEIAIATEPYSD